MYCSVCTIQHARSWGDFALLKEGVHKHSRRCFCFALARHAAVIVALFVCALSIADTDLSADLITVKSEEVHLNRQTGIQTLTGNVVITHNDIAISADTIQITTSNSAISRIYGKGTPIRFQQRLSNGEMIRTESNEIDYLTRSWTLVFRGDVSLQRGDMKLEASAVEYNLRNKNYIATNTTDTDSGLDKSRVEFTYLKSH